MGFRNGMSYRHRIMVSRSYQDAVHYFKQYVVCSPSRFRLLNPNIFTVRKEYSRLLRFVGDLYMVDERSRKGWILRSFQDTVSDRRHFPGSTSEKPLFLDVNIHITCIPDNCR